jgi:hypothetical protein
MSKHERPMRVHDFSLSNCSETFEVSETSKVFPSEGSPGVNYGLNAIACGILIPSCGV